MTLPAHDGASSREPAERLELPAEGMTCASCADRVERKLKGRAGSVSDAALPKGFVFHHGKALEWNASVSGAGAHELMRPWREGRPALVPPQGEHRRSPANVEAGPAGAAPRDARHRRRDRDLPDARRRRTERDGHERRQAATLDEKR